MKHLFILLVLLLCVGPARAQTQLQAGDVLLLGYREYEAPLTAFADSINRVFQYVDKTRVPSGILQMNRTMRN